MAIGTAAATDLIARATTVGLDIDELITASGQQAPVARYGWQKIDEMRVEKVALFNRRDADRADDLIAKRETAANAAVQAVAPSNELMATASQVAYIQRLRAQRAQDGETRGFMSFDGDPAMLTRRQASSYIDSLTGSY